LSNEIYYEIFEYLDGCDIYEAFSNLNNRIQHLITYPTFLLKITLINELQRQIKHRCTHVILPNRHRIISLVLRNSSLIDTFLNQCVIDSSFSRLQSIFFVDLSAHRLMLILFYLKSLPLLRVLTIYLQDNCCDDLRDIYRMIFHLPVLKYNRLSLTKDENFNVLVPFAANEQFNTIEYLIMNHRCNLNELISVIQHTPRLRHLTCQSIVEFEDNAESQASMTLSNLIHLHIYDCYVAFDEFEEFMKKICSQLQVLQINEFGIEKYTDPERWERLILQNMPHLLKFHLKCYVHIDDHFNDIHFDTFVRQFTSQFWIERKWIFYLEIDSKEIFYSIHPYK
jgi:hypothetical protein